MTTFIRTIIVIAIGFAGTLCTLVAADARTYRLPKGAHRE